MRWYLLNRYALRIGQTIATVLAEDEFLPQARQAVHDSRQEIIDYIDSDPGFKFSLAPVAVSNKAPQVVRRMAEAGYKVGVGPMAAVAGCIAQYVVEHMIAAGAEHIVFDNGGDIALYLSNPIVVGIYAGSRGASGLGFSIDRIGELLGLCTSSASVGHSLSLGCTDASIVLSRDVALADAAATALGNVVTSPDKSQMRFCMQEMMIDGVEGVMVIVGNTIGVHGNLPRIVRANVTYDLISKG